MSSSEQQKPEPLLQKRPHKRFVLFPIEFQDIFDMYKVAVNTFWVSEEVDLERDVVHWDNDLTEDMRHYLKVILSFFASADNLVNFNLLENFQRELADIPEIQCFYGFQCAIENIHAEVYSTLVDRFVRDKKEKMRILNGIETIPAVKKKAEWALKWTDPAHATFQERLVAFAVVEGLLFSASFCAIFYFKQRSLMPGLTFSNELISRDEGLHCDFACLLYTKYIVNKLPEEQVQKIVQEAVEIETEFVTTALPVSLIGMKASNMVQYVKFCADRLLRALGYSNMYNCTCPFDWMTTISIDGKTNFFERRVGEYSKGLSLSKSGGKLLADNFEFGSGDF